MFVQLPMLIAALMSIGKHNLTYRLRHVTILSSLWKEFVFGPVEEEHCIVHVTLLFAC